MAIDRSVVFSLGAKIKTGFGAALDSIRGKIKGLGGAWDSIWKMGAAYNGLKSIGQDLKSFAFSTANAGAEINDLSIKTGISAETLSKLKYAAGLADIGIGDAADGFRKMNLAMAKAQKGSDDAAWAFHAVGISMEDIQKLPQEEIFARAGEALLKIESSSKRAAVGNAIFGKSFQSLMPMFGTLRQDMADAANRTTIWTQVTAAAADKFGDNWTAVEGVAGKVIDAFFNGLIPSVNELTDSILAMTDENIKLIATDVAAWGREAGKTFLDFAKYVRDISSNGDFSVWWAKFNADIAAVNVVLGVAVGGFKSLVALAMEFLALGSSIKAKTDSMFGEGIMKYSAPGLIYNSIMPKKDIMGDTAKQAALKYGSHADEMWESAKRSSTDAIRQSQIANMQVSAAIARRDADKKNNYVQPNALAIGQNIGTQLGEATQDLAVKVNTGAMNGYKNVLGARDTSEFSDGTAAGVGP